MTVSERLKPRSKVLSGVRPPDKSRPETGTHRSHGCRWCHRPRHYIAMASIHEYEREEPRPIRLLLSAPEVAERLSLSERGVRVLIARGEIPSVRVGSRRLVRSADLDRYVAGLAPA